LGDFARFRTGTTIHRLSAPATVALAPKADFIDPHSAGALERCPIRSKGYSHASDAKAETQGQAILRLSPVPAGAGFPTRGRRPSSGSRAGLSRESAFPAMHVSPIRNTLKWSCAGLKGWTARERHRCAKLAKQLQRGVAAAAVERRQVFDVDVFRKACRGAQLCARIPIVSGRTGWVGGDRVLSGASPRFTPRFWRARAAGISGSCRSRFWGGGRRSRCAAP
jgi:hypothetical protein